MGMGYTHEILAEICFIIVLRWVGFGAPYWFTINTKRSQKFQCVGRRAPVSHQICFSSE